MSPPYILDWVGDSLRETLGMTLEQIGLWQRLKYTCWEQKPQCTMPSDNAESASLLGISQARWIRFKPFVMKGWELKGNRLVHTKLLQQYTDAVMRIEKRSQAGKIGNAVRWHGGKDPSVCESDCDPIAIPLRSPSSSSSELVKKRASKFSRAERASAVQLEKEIGQQHNSADNSEINNTPTPNQEKNAPARPASAPRGTVEDLFARAFWPAYPRKQHRKQALAVFRLISPGEDLLRLILRCLEVDKAEWAEKDPKWTPLPERWLKSKRWQDE